MDGVKVTYIETRFVTSDAAGFKDLVQRLTGRSPTPAAGAVAPAPAAAPHRPRACRADDGGASCGRSASAAAAAAGTPGYNYYYHASASSSSSPAAHEPRVGDDGRLAPPCLDEATYGVGDFSDLLRGTASQNAQYVQSG